jgi:hypothetical protein
LGKKKSSPWNMRGAEIRRKTLHNSRNLDVIIANAIHEKAFQRLVVNLLMVYCYQRR